MFCFCICFILLLHGPVFLTQECEIQKVHETNEPDTMEAHLKMIYKSKKVNVPKHGAPFSFVAQSH
jgi:hypothetical protein